MFILCVCVHVTQLCPALVSCQAPLSMGFSRQGYWDELTFPAAGDLSDPGIEPGSPVLQADSLPTELRGKPIGLSLRWSSFRIMASRFVYVMAWVGISFLPKVRSYPYVCTTFLGYTFYLAFDIYCHLACELHGDKKTRRIHILILFRVSSISLSTCFNRPVSAHFTHTPQSPCPGAERGGTDLLGVTEGNLVLCNADRSSDGLIK